MLTRRPGARSAVARPGAEPSDARDGGPLDPRVGGGRRGPGAHLYPSFPAAAAGAACWPRAHLSRLDPLSRGRWVTEASSPPGRTCALAPSLLPLRPEMTPFTLDRLPRRRLVLAPPFFNWV